MIAAITGKKCSAIAVIIWKPHFGDHSDFRISQQLLKSAFHMIATIAKCFFPAIIAIVAVMWKPAFIFNVVRLFTRSSIFALFIWFNATYQ